MQANSLEPIAPTQPSAAASQKTGKTAAPSKDPCDNPAFQKTLAQEAACREREKREYGAKSWFSFLTEKENRLSPEELKAFYGAKTEDSSGRHLSPKNITAVEKAGSRIFEEDDNFSTAKEILRDADGQRKYLFPNELAFIQHLDRSLANLIKPKIFDRLIAMRNGEGDIESARADRRKGLYKIELIQEMVDNLERNKDLLPQDISNLLQQARAKPYLLRRSDIWQKLSEENNLLEAPSYLDARLDSEGAYRYVFLPGMRAILAEIKCNPSAINKYRKQLLAARNEVYNAVYDTDDSNLNRPPANINSAPCTQ